MTSRELVYATLEFRNTEGRIPRQMWVLPWAGLHHEAMLRKIRQDFPDDIAGVPFHYKDPPKTSGNPHEPGEYIDEWGCRFVNITRGVIGEVKRPMIPAEDENWDGASAVHIPEELLSFDIDEINRGCAQTDKFVMAGFCPRPFEQLQFIRGTENLYVDIMDPPKKMLGFIKRMHDFYCRGMEKWAKTDVDSLNFMDDWGSQRSLLIPPALWRELFMPLYRDYIDIAHSRGKKIFMHSDGYTLDIIPFLIELGLDAINSQVFCMGAENLQRFRGRITFWGEIDRQHLLPYGSLSDIENAVHAVYDNLWQDGGVIAQFEFGAGANPENAYHVFETYAGIR